MFERHVSGDAGIVVSFHTGDVPRADDVDHLIGLGAVSDQIAQAIHGIRGLSVEMFQNGFKRGQIGVDVGNEGEFQLCELFVV